MFSPNGDPQLSESGGNLRPVFDTQLSPTLKCRVSLVGRDNLTELNQFQSNVATKADICFLPHQVTSQSTCICSPGSVSKCTTGLRDDRWYRNIRFRRNGGLLVMETWNKASMLLTLIISHHQIHDYSYGLDLRN
jgi:hypothetical protein